MRLYLRFNILYVRHRLSPVNEILNIFLKFCNNYLVIRLVKDYKTVLLFWTPEE